MVRIFLVLPLMLALMLLGGCERQSVTPTRVPHEITAVTQPFLQAVRRGDQRTAEKYVVPGFIDDSNVQFKDMSAILKKSPPLVPAIHLKQMDSSYVTYAAQDGPRWITAEIRVARVDGKSVVEYWDVTAATQPPEMLRHAQDMRQYMRYAMIGAALSALAGLALLIWLVRNRTHIISPNAVVETRRVASTVRDSVEAPSP